MTSSDLYPFCLRPNKNQISAQNLFFLIFWASDLNHIYQQLQICESMPNIII